MREQSVDAQAARRAGLAARRERIAAADTQLQRARETYRAAESRLLRLQRNDAPAAAVEKARAAVLATVPALVAAKDLLADARAPRRTRPGAPTGARTSNDRRSG